MIYLHISYQEKSKDDWKDILVSEFQPFNKLYPDEPARNKSFGIKDNFTTPCGLSFSFTAYFSSEDFLINYLVELGGETILSNSSYKKSLETFEPSVILQLSNRSNLSITFSSLLEVERI